MFWDRLDVWEYNCWIFYIDDELSDFMECKEYFIDELLYVVNDNLYFDFFEIIEENWVSCIIVE